MATLNNHADFCLTGEYRLNTAMTVPALVILTGRLMRILIKTLAAKSPATKTVQHVLQAYVPFAAAGITFPATGAFPVRKMQLVTENQSAVTTATRKRMEFASRRKQFIPARHI